MASNSHVRRCTRLQTAVTLRQEQQRGRWMRRATGLLWAVPAQSSRRRTERVARRVAEGLKSQAAAQGSAGQRMGMGMGWIRRAKRGSCWLPVPGWAGIVLSPPMADREPWMDITLLLLLPLLLPLPPTLFSALFCSALRCAASFSLLYSSTRPQGSPSHARFCCSCSQAVISPRTTRFLLSFFSVPYFWPSLWSPYRRPVSRAQHSKHRIDLSSSASSQQSSCYRPASAFPPRRRIQMQMYKMHRQ